MLEVKLALVIMKTTYALWKLIKHAKSAHVIDTLSSNIEYAADTTMYVAKFS